MKRGERIRRDFWPGVRNGGQERGLAGVGIADQADFGDDAKFEEVVALSARFAGLGEARGLPRRSGKIAIAQAAAPTLAQHKLLSVLGQVNNQMPAFGSRGGMAGVFAGEVNLEGAAAAGGTELGPAAGAGLDGG